MALPRVYTLSQCSTCKTAVAFLRARGVQFTEIPIRVQPPSPEELRRMLSLTGGDVKKLYNTSGLEYKAQGMKDRLPSLTEDEALALLAGNGSLVKRPFLLTDTGGAVGFKEPEWSALFPA